MVLELKGIHHVSAFTANAAENYKFYTKTLGLRLIKKTVNQDDTSMYHLFYGDEEGHPGTELTFFEIPMAAPNHNGNNSISELSLRVKDDKALVFWKKRFKEMNVAHDDITVENRRSVLRFKDPEGQRLVLVSDEGNEKGVPGGKPWDKGPIPLEYGIIGLGPVKLTVPDKGPTEDLLTTIMGFRKVGSYPSSVSGQPDILVYETGLGGTGAEIHLEERKDLPRERLGRGGVHHVAFRVENEDELRNWVRKLKELRIASSGFVERYYFKSLYFREPNGILFELATDGPGFEADEPFEQLGEKLALPPYIEDSREEIEAKITPLDTKSE